MVRLKHLKVIDDPKSPRFIYLGSLWRFPCHQSNDSKSGPCVVARRKHDLRANQMGYSWADRPTKNSIAGWNLDKMKQHLSIYLSVCLSIYLSIYLSYLILSYLILSYLTIYLSLYPSIHPSIHLSTYPSIYMCVCVVGCFDSFWMSQSMCANQPGLLMPRAENIGTFVFNVTWPYSHTIVRYWHPCLSFSLSVDVSAKRQ